MSGIGPSLPPHLLAKRKRQEEEEAKDEVAASSGAKRSASPGESEKRRRVMGPAMPPAPLEERPLEPLEQVGESDSDDDDDFGPSLPRTGADITNDTSVTRQHAQSLVEATSSEPKPKRDDWMMMPPKQDDLAARMDPTKQRARGFNTGKGAKAPQGAGEDNSAWNETPEQKQKRLADEMMGVSKSSDTGPRRSAKPTAPRDEVAAKQVKEHVEKTRGPSLLERHAKNVGAEVEDDPSKRAFDREKDMGSGMRIGNVQRQQMLNKASDYSSKFSGGSYL